MYGYCVLIETIDRMSKHIRALLYFDLYIKKHTGWIVDFENRFQNKYKN